MTASEADQSPPLPPLNAMDAAALRLSTETAISVDWAQRIVRIADTAIQVAQTQDEFPVLTTLRDRFRFYWADNPSRATLEGILHRTIITGAEEAGLTVDILQRSSDQGHGPRSSRGNVPVGRAFVRVEDH